MDSRKKPSNAKSKYLNSKRESSAKDNRVPRNGQRGPPGPSAPMPPTQDYYVPGDYEQVMQRLPDLIDEAKRRALDIVEPTIHEKRQVMAVIKDFIRERERRIYGGTAMDMALKSVDPTAGIYDDTLFADIEFYSPDPVSDLRDLSLLLHDKNFKYVKAREAQHEETYSIFVNFQGYCDITYMPTRIYYKVKTIQIDGIYYVHPHFIFIDQLRIFSQPLTAADQRWEKTFNRCFRILKYFPLEMFVNTVNLSISPEIKDLIPILRQDLLSNPAFYEDVLITGFMAYNFFVKHAARSVDVEQQSRTTYSENNVLNLICDVPYVEVVSVSYAKSAELAYAFLKSVVKDPAKLTITELHPFFQFIGRTLIFNYDGRPLLKIFDGEGYCIPKIKTSANYMYVSYQYELMFLMIMRFKAFVDEDAQMYKNYRVIVSNLIDVRNIYLQETGKPVINDSVFSEFRISCAGITSTPMRQSQLRGLEKLRHGKAVIYRFEPEAFRKMTPEAQEKAIEASKKFQFQNSSGNIINPHKQTFLIENGTLVRNSGGVDSDTEADSETGKTSGKNRLKKNERASSLPEDSEIDPALRDDDDLFLAENAFI